MARSCFTLQGSVSEGSVRVADLHPALRGLLFTDGTLTRAVSVQTMSQVSVDVLEQDRPAVAPPEAVEHLGCRPGSRVLRRRVAITSQHESCRIWAESYIATARLPGRFPRLLASAPLGIGEAINELGLASRRELLWFCMEAPPRWTRAGDAQQVLRRLYRIDVDGRPALLISELFAVEWRRGTLRLAGVAS